MDVDNDGDSEDAGSGGGKPLHGRVDLQRPGRANSPRGDGRGTISVQCSVLLLQNIQGPCSCLVQAIGFKKGSLKEKTMFLPVKTKILYQGQDIAVPLP